MQHSEEKKRFYIVLMFPFCHSTHHELHRSQMRLPHLCLGQHQGGGHFEAFGSGQVLVEFKLVLQLKQLLAGEGRAWPPTFTHQP